MIIDRVRSYDFASAVKRNLLYSHLPMTAETARARLLTEAVWRIADLEVKQVRMQRFMNPHKPSEATSSNGGEDQRRDPFFLAPDGDLCRRSCLRRVRHLDQSRYLSASYGLTIQLDGVGARG